MLGDILGELGWSLIGDLLSPSTDRGRVRFNLGLSVTAVSAQGFAFTAFDNPLRGSEWAFGLMMLGMLLGIVALVFSVASLVRLEGYRGLSVITALLGGLAACWPLLG